MRWPWVGLTFKNRMPKHRNTQPKAWLHRLGHSLRWRLVVLFLGLALAMSATFVVGTTKAFSGGWRAAVKPLLTDYVDRLALDIGSPPDARKAQALTNRLPISVRIEGPNTQFDSHPLRHAGPWQNANFDASEAGSGFLKRKTPDGHTITFGLGNMEWRRGPGMFGWLTLALLLALTALAFMYVRRLFKPLDDIGAGVARFGKGNFAQRIEIARADELGDLAAQINTMGQEIAQMLDAKRALLLAISHELRSPLTRARLNTELLPESGDTLTQRNALLRDLGEMTRLITDLLESERLSGTHAALTLEPTNLNALVQEVLNDMTGLDETTQAAQSTPLRNAGLILNIPNDLPLMWIDPIRIKLLLRNLLDNAKRHGSYGRIAAAGVMPPIELTVAMIATGPVPCVQLTVRDYGPGVTNDQLPQLAQAFFRADTARQRSTGGVGLGLYLCRLIAAAHGGELILENAQPGLQARVTLPTENDKLVRFFAI